jgi:dUTP pyrophosphatase
MSIPGKCLSQIISGTLDEDLQIQPCGVDLTLKLVLKPTTAGCLDFDNSQRKAASTTPLPFEPSADHSEDPKFDFIHLDRGVYLVEFNETVTVPLDKMGQLFPRSSLWRSCAMITAGVVDSGYSGCLGAQLVVNNPYGLKVVRNARLAQIVFVQMTDVVGGYSGVYQGSATICATDV